jgi:hypothetical protein
MMDTIPFTTLRALHRTDTNRATRLWAAGHPVTFTMPDCVYAVAGLTHADFSDGRFADLMQMAGQARRGLAMTIPQAIRDGLRLSPGWAGSARMDATVLDDLGAALAVAGLAQATAGRMTGGMLAPASDGAITVTFATLAEQAA